MPPGPRFMVYQRLVCLLLWLQLGTLPRERSSASSRDSGSLEENVEENVNQALGELGFNISVNSIVGFLRASTGMTPLGEREKRQVISLGPKIVYAACSDAARLPGLLTGRRRSLRTWRISVNGMALRCTSLPVVMSDSAGGRLVESRAGEHMVLRQLWLETRKAREPLFKRVVLAQYVVLANLFAELFHGRGVHLVLDVRSVKDNSVDIIFPGCNGRFCHITPDMLRAVFKDFSESKGVSTSSLNIWGFLARIQYRPRGNVGRSTCLRGIVRRCLCYEA